MKCHICREIIQDSEIIEHHTDYEHEESIFVCRSCHNDIHKSGLYPKLNPNENRPKKYVSGGYISLYLPKIYYEFVKKNVGDINKWFRNKIDVEKENLPDYCKEQIKYWQNKLEKAKDEKK